MTPWVHSGQEEGGKGSGPGSAQKADSAAAGKTIRALVIGGMTMTGLWQEIAARFVAPILGAVIAALVWKFGFDKE